MVPTLIDDSAGLVVQGLVLGEHRGAASQPIQGLLGIVIPIRTLRHFNSQVRRYLDHDVPGEDTDGEGTELRLPADLLCVPAFRTKGEDFSSLGLSLSMLVLRSALLGTRMIRSSLLPFCSLTREGPTEAGAFWSS